MSRGYCGQCGHAYDDEAEIHECPPQLSGNSGPFATPPASTGNEILTERRFRSLADCATGFLVRDDTTPTQMEQVEVYSQKLLAHDAALRVREKALEKDQGDWRKGVGCIKAAIFPRERQPKGLSCVHIAEAVLNLSADYEKSRTREGALEEALEDQRDRWHRLPSGVDGEADPHDASPQDAVAWEAGLAVRAIDAALQRRGGGE